MSKILDLLANGMDINRLRTNAVLQKDEWVEMDERVIQIAQERLTVTQDLIDTGLVYDLGGIGTTISQWQLESDMTEAVVSMEPDSEGNRDLLNYNTAQTPIPIISKDFRIGLRQLEASRRNGSRIDLTNADAAARVVARGVEKLILRGNSASFAGNKIYGATNHPYTITGTAPGTWASDVDNAFKTIRHGLELADKNQRYGPFNVYVAPGLGLHLYDYYSDGSGQTVADRIENLPNINKLRVSDVLAPGTIAMIQMTSDTIDIAVAQTLITVEWDEKGGMASNFKVLTALAPRIKPDANGKLGIVYMTGA